MVFGLFSLAFSLLEVLLIALLGSLAGSVCVCFLWFWVGVCLCVFSGLFGGFLGEFWRVSVFAISLGWFLFFSLLSGVCLFFLGYLVAH